MMLAWWQHLILTRYETHGLVDKIPAALACLEEISQGRWQVFDYELQHTVFIVGPSKDYPEVGEVHVWGNGGNILRAGRLFMREVWAHSHYVALLTAIMDQRVECYAERFRWKKISVGEHGQRFWMIARYAA